MAAAQSGGVPQTPSPREGEPPRAAERAADRADDGITDDRAETTDRVETTDGAETEVADLDPDESADIFETPEEAETAKPTRTDQRDDDDVITLDTSD